MMPLFARNAFFIKILFLFLYTSSTLADSSHLDAVQKLQHEWAMAKYQTSSKKQLKKLSKLIDEAKDLHEQQPDNPEILLWYGMILTTYANIKGPVALSSLKEARKVLEQALKLDPNVGNGLAEAVLGSLYARAPNWPIAFGNKRKANIHFENALEIDPDGIDTNYYYGDYLILIGEYDKAKIHLDIADNADIRPEYSIQDTGRKKEIKKSLAQLKKLKR